MYKNLTKALGELVYAFAGLEDSLNEGFAQILNISYSDARIIFSAIPFTKKIQIIKALYRKNENYYIDFVLLDKALKLNEKRNILIHSTWDAYSSINKTTIKRSKVNYKKSTNTEIPQVVFNKEKLKELNEIIVEIDKCKEQLIYHFSMDNS